MVDLKLKGSVVKIFVENLTHSITNKDLIKLFELSGVVESVTIVNDKFSGKPGGFVEIPNRLEALRMIQNLNGVTLFDEILNLSAMREGVDRRADAERRSDPERRASKDRRIVAERRNKSVGYAFDDRRVSSQRKTEFDRRLINERRESSELRSGTDRRYQQ